MTIVFFDVDKEGCGRIKRRGKWQYSIEEDSIPGRPPARTGPGCRIRRLTVRLPAHSRGKREWTKEEWQAYLQGLDVPPEGRGVYYLYGEEAERLLRRSAEPLPAEWLFVLLDCFDVTFDALIVLHDREMETEKLVTRYIGSTRYVGIVTRETDTFAGFAGMISEEYGFLLDIASDIRGLHRPARGETLIIAGTALDGITPSMLPPRSTWLSNCAADSEGRHLCSRLGDIRYLDIWKLALM